MSGLGSYKRIKNQDKRKKMIIGASEFEWAIKMSNYRNRNYVNSFWHSYHTMVIKNSSETALTINFEKRLRLQGS